MRSRAVRALVRQFSLDTLAKRQHVLAQQLAAVLSAGVYTKEDLQSAVCSYVAEMKQAGETGDTVVQTAQRLAAEVGERFPAAGNTQAILGDILTWCLAEYYRESA